MRSIRPGHLLALAWAFSAIGACGSDETARKPMPGTEGAPCYPNRTCNDGLTCEAEVCIALGDAAASAGGAATNTGGTGSGGTSVGGGNPAGGAAAADGGETGTGGGAGGALADAGRDGSSGGGSEAGGSLSAGGAPGSGGDPGAGGSPGGGGTTGAGGDPGAGGVSGTGGVPGAGGDLGAGGGPGAGGGDPGTGGSPGSGGDPGSGGASGSGGTPGAGGDLGAGGTPGAGGATGAGGSAGAGGTLSSGGTSGDGGTLGAGGTPGAGGDTMDGGQPPDGGSSGSDGGVAPDENDPTARFTASPVGGTSVVVDATASSDLETPAGELEVRWDFTSDGAWDTSFSTSRVDLHDFGANGVYTVALEVRDRAGRTHTTTRGVSVGGLSFVGGTVNTTTWSGTVVVQSDVVVPAGHTLTIAPGTQVLFVYVAGVNGDGTVGITINGSLDVQGTATEPVIFSTFGTTRRQPKAWEGIRVPGENLTIRHALFEYGTTALQVQCVDTPADVTDSVFQLSSIGVSHSCSSSATTNFDRIVARDNVSYGVVAGAGANLRNSTVERNGTGISAGGSAITNTTVQDNLGDGLVGTGTSSSSVSILFSRFLRNGGAGVHSGQNGGMSVTQSDIIGNGVGVRVSLCGGLDVTNSEIRGNLHEALQIQNSCPANMTPRPIALTDSNITGNAVTGAGTIVSPGLSASTLGATVIDGPWATPNGEIVEQLRWTFTESQFANGVGTVRSGDGTVIATATTSTASGWLDVSAFAASDLVIELDRIGGSSGWGVSMAVSDVFYYEIGSPSAAVIIDTDVDVDLRRNYWGNGSPVFFGFQGRIDASAPRGTPVLGAGAP